ncbi:MAG: hypothetical protein ACREU8_09755 [Gammaproteobacteria bacterium]
MAPPGCSLVPKLRLGNPMREAPASRDGWYRSWSFEGRIPKLELGNERLPPYGCRDGDPPGCGWAIDFTTYGKAVLKGWMAWRGRWLRLAP